MTTYKAHQMARKAMLCGGASYTHPDVNSPWQRWWCVCAPVMAWMLAVNLCPGAMADGAIATIPWAAGKIQVDGALSEPDWQGALTLGPFTGAINGDTNRAALQAANRTEAKLLWRDNRLFVAFLCHSPRPAWATYTRHDEPLSQQDVCEVFVRTQTDTAAYAEFQASPLGATFDAVHAWRSPPTFPADCIDWERVAKDHTSDAAWNPTEFTAACRPLDAEPRGAGWVVEMAIPLDAVRARAGGEAGVTPRQTIWVNLLRYIYEPDASGRRELLQQNWSPVMAGCPHVSPMAMRPLELGSRREERGGDPPHATPL